MFNKNVKDKIGEDLEFVKGQYEKKYSQTVKKADALYAKRKSAAKAIENAEKKINRFKNTPIKLSDEFDEIDIKAKNFLTVSKIAEKESKKCIDRARAAGTLSAAGVGAALAGPSAVAAFATTFGTASTGVAISTLSGAAAESAVMAWIGGGTIAAGGGGMAAGEALLAAIGPIGWIVGMGIAIGAIGYVAGKNRRIAKAEEKAIKDAYKAINNLEIINNKLDKLTKETTCLEKELNDAVKGFGIVLNDNYEKLSEKHKQSMIKIANKASQLSGLLGVVIK